MSHRLLLFLVCCVSIAINLTGLRWGLPDDAYRRFFYSTDGQAHILAGGVSPSYVRQSWSVSRTSPDGKLPRSTFNIIRSFHPDEHNILKSISNMDPGKFDFNPHFFEYPSFYIYLVALLLKLLSAMRILTITSDISFYFLHPSSMGAIYLAGRCLTVAFSLIGVICVYLAGRRLFDREVGLVAALFLALTPAYAINSHYLTVDVPMTALSCAGIVFLCRYMDTRLLRDLSAGSILFGLAASTKYPAASLWLLVPFVLFSSAHPAAAPLLRRAGLSLVLFALSFFAGSPYILLSPTEFARDFLYQVSARGVGSGTLWQIFFASIRDIFPALFVGCSWLLLLSGVGLLLCVLSRGRQRLFVVAGVVAASLPLLATAGVKYVRYYLPLLPFLVLAAGYTTIHALRDRRIAWLAAVGTIMCAGSIAVKTIAYAAHMHRTDVRILAAEYLERLPPAATVGFLQDPWIFQVPPVNPFARHILVGNPLDGSAIPDYLVIGELEYFQTGGDRRDRQWLQPFLESFAVEKEFRLDPSILGITFDTEFMLHDMLYTHPGIFILRRRTPS